ncbi:MAG: penicillin-binding protein activator LpoB [Flavobacteriales bacterium]|mgnify:FL=1|nr:penicillin-binding protein activator LpoB [Flavobacteriales bacterium]|tara:strand:- start:12351 stop:12944 length:594 start_codon:yes stop_codon:yes gene_type:complete
MKSRKILILSALIATATIFQGCNNTKQVTRVEEDSVIDLSGRWNDTDSRLVAEEMVSDMLLRPWLEEFEKGTGERPVVVVGLVQNKSHEHIATETFIKDIEKAILNSGKVRLVQAGEAREQLRKERADQNEFATAATAAKWGKELGADFILQGVLNSIVDSNNKQKVIFYQTDLELTNMETNEKVWIGDKKIKKVVD